MLDKTKIHAHCTQLLNDKISGIQQLIADARAASNDDTKSSMGDKYETTREMMQIELDKLGKQLQDAQQMLLGLKVLDPTKKCEKAEPGALVFTDRGVFYLAVGLGKVALGAEIVMVVSAGSPVGKMMNGKKNDSVFSANNVVYKVRTIR